MTRSHIGTHTALTCRPSFFRAAHRRALALALDGDAAKELGDEDEVEDEMGFFSMLIRAGRVSGASSRSIRGCRSMIQ